MENSKSYTSISNSLFYNHCRSRLLIWDNSPTSQEVPLETNVWTNIQYYHSPDNEGLGVAYNYAVECARKFEIKWVGLLDQDTTFSSDYIIKILNSIEQNKMVNLFAPIVRLKSGIPFSPFRYKHKRGYPVNLSFGIYSLLTYVPINSGMVINTISFDNCGGYKPEIKLDFADVQFIERFRLLDSNFYVVDTVAFQDFSNDETDIVKLKTRFQLYCECAKKCDKQNMIDYIEYFYTVFRHTFALVLRTKNLVFIHLMVKKYIL